MKSGIKSEAGVKVNVPGYVIQYQFRLLLILTSFLTISTSSFSQKTIKITKTANPPQIDGFVNDACWASSGKINDFLQREPREGEPMTERTEVSICYDTNNIYFGIRCYQETPITAKEMQRDASLGTDDRIAIILDTFLDRRSAFFFGINALGAIEDATVNQNGMNRSWNGLFVAKAKITDIGWEAEFSIPFKSISFDENGTKWGLLMNRFIRRKREWGSWPVANLNSSQFQVSDGGTIEGIEGITQGFGLDISPYFISGIDTRREEKTKYKINGGTDVFYQVTPSLKASLSINTDFAETEADPRQINLTRFNLRLEEKRNFFLDGSNYFSFGMEGRNMEAPSGKINPFFSRSIGLSSKGIPIPVNYGAKLTGQISNWNIGLLHVSDRRDYGNSNFSVGRVKYNIGSQSSVGIIGTFGNSIDSLGNNLIGMDLKLGNNKFMGDKIISLSMFGLKSFTENTKGSDYSFGGLLSYPNDFLNFRLGLIQIGRNFTAGIGYVPRPGINEVFGDLRLGPRPKGIGIRQVTFGGGFDYVSNLSGQLQSKDFNINPLGIIFESGERLSYTIFRKYDFVDSDFNIYADYIIPTGEYQWWENRLSMESEGSRNIYGEIEYSFGNFYTGDRNSLSITTNWKVIVPVFVGATFSRDLVKIPDGEFRADIYQINANFLFSPDLTLYNYFQYDSQSGKLGWQSRFQWILKPGNEILLVWNSGYTKPFERYVMNESSMRLKIKYNIRF